MVDEKRTYATPLPRSIKKNLTIRMMMLMRTTTTSTTTTTITQRGPDHSNGSNNTCALNNQSLVCIAPKYTRIRLILVGDMDQKSTKDYDGGGECILCMHKHKKGTIC